MLHVLWLAALLGIAIQGLILMVTGMDALLRVKPLMVDLTQKISWSVVVCLGLALGLPGLWSLLPLALGAAALAAWLVSATRGSDRSAPPPPPP